MWDFFLDYDFNLYFLYVDTNILFLFESVLIVDVFIRNFLFNLACAGLFTIISDTDG